LRQGVKQAREARKKYDPTGRRVEIFSDTDLAD
jgi:hypothetical protein